MPDSGLPLETTTPEPGVQALRTQIYIQAAMCILLACFALYFARELVLPILVAILLKLVLAPVVRQLSRVHIPEPLGAAIVLGVLTCAIAYGTFALSTSATEWVTRIPQRIWVLRGHLQHVQGLLEFVRQAGQSITELSKIADRTDVTPTPTPAVVASDSGMGPMMVSETAGIVFSIGSMLVLLFFLLASGDMFLRKLVTVLPSFGDKKQAVEIANQVQADVSHYLLTITLINAALGAIVGLILQIIGMPSPWLWGATVGVLNFVPYLGPLTSLAIIALVSLMSFPDWQIALMPPVAVLGICTAEGQFITPTIVARRLVLNPVAVFVALMFCGWLWGVIGVVLSVPLLAVLKIFCDHVKPLLPIGEFLGR